MNRKHFLILYGVDPVRWARRWGLEPFTHPCSECGALLTTTLPFARDTLRGIIAPPCACGNTCTPYEVVRDPAHGDVFTDRSGRGLAS